MQYRHVQTVSIIDIDKNIKPVYWTKGKQKPSNRYTYFEQLVFHITGSKKDIDDKDIYTRWERFTKSYNAGREITIVVIKHSFALIRNSANTPYSENRKEKFTVDRKRNPLTQEQLDYILNTLIASEDACWYQENR